MTPDEIPEIHARQRPGRPRSTTTQFGLLRTFLWMSPGFGAAALWIALSDFRSVIYCPDLPLRCWITGAVALLSVAAFAWLDALANPAVRKQDGHPTARALWISLVWFTGGQVLTMPPVFCSTIVFAEVAGFRS